jgi:amino acid transporter
MINRPRITILLVIALTSIVIASTVSIAIQFQQTALAQNSSNSNPLAKIPVIGKLVGGDKAGNATTNSSSAGNATSSGNQSSSNPLAKIPVIGKLLGGK